MTSRRPLVVVIGPPGAGKGTQCARLAAVTGCAHVSLGDSLREEIARGSELGARLERYVESGGLVPDALVVDVAKEQLDRCTQSRGVLLDGFPRTVTQAVALASLAPDAVRLCVALVVPRRQLLQRLGARGRRDDQPAVIRTRLVSYERDTRPLLDWYAARGLLRPVDGGGLPGAVTRNLQRLLVEAGVCEVAKIDAG